MHLVVLYTPPLPFTAFQGLYKAKAAKDTAAMTALVDKALALAGRPAGTVSQEEVEIFCKNARKLLVNGSRVIEWGGLSWIKVDSVEFGCISSVIFDRTEQD